MGRGRRPRTGDYD